jgi:peptidoglycan/LPS O-acetylase OafA/YrhL
MVVVTMPTSTPLSEAVVSMRKEGSSPLHPNFALNLSCLDGMRCLASFAVVLYHVHFMHGGGFFLSSEPCYASMRQTPIVGFLVLEISWHMTLFWLISGFLCERQLHQMMYRHQNSQTTALDTKTGLTLRHFVRFFTNRLLRLYPLYLLLSIIIFTHHSSRPELKAPGMELSRCDAAGLWRAMTFTMDLEKGERLCAGPAWTLQNDIHGHLVILLMFAMTHRYTYNTENEKQTRFLRYKQLVWWGWYAFSILSMVGTRPFPSQWLSGEALQHFLQSARVGVDMFLDRNMVLVDVTRSGLGDLFPERHHPMIQEIRDFRIHQIYSTYFTGIARHGSSIVLGSLLYSNLYGRRGQASNSLAKLLAAVTLLLVSQGSYIFSGLVMYLLTDVILTFDPLSNAWSNAVHQFLTNPLFQMIAPYTYGTYLFHIIYVVARSSKMIPIRAALVREGVAACEAGIQYNWQYLWKETMITFTVSLMVAYVLHWTYEVPFHSFRKRFQSGDTPLRLRRKDKLV